MRPMRNAQWAMAMNNEQHQHGLGRCGLSGCGLAQHATSLRLSALVLVCVCARHWLLVVGLGLEMEPQHHQSQNA